MRDETFYISGQDHDEFITLLFANCFFHLALVLCDGFIVTTLSGSRTLGRSSMKIIFGRTNVI